MDETGFDAWTRRRFGMAAGGLAASLATLANIRETAAKKKKKPKGLQCCIKGTKCGETFGERDFRCCTGFRCPVKGSAKPDCLCKSPGQFCTANVQCCSNDCVENPNPSPAPPFVCGTKR
jgi:hypothetical protein